MLGRKASGGGIWTKKKGVLTVCLKDHAREVERAANQDAGAGGLCKDGRERGLRIFGGVRSEAGGAGLGHGFFCRKGCCLTRNRDSLEAFCNTSQRVHEAAHILGVQHTADQMRGFGGQARERFDDGLRGGGVVATIEPEVAADSIRHVNQRASLEPLHPGGPFGAGDGGLARILSETEMAQGGQNRARVHDLVGTDEVGQGQIKQAGFILEDQPTAFFPDLPVLTMDEEWRAEAGGAGLDHLDRKSVV